MRRGMRILSRSLLVAVPLGVAGCARAGHGGSSGRLVVQRDTVGDTVVVRTVSGSVWGAPRTLAPEVSIGKESGDSAYLFGRISGLAVAPDGRIYVLDGQTMEIRSYGPDGVYRATIARRGGGPGELRMPGGMTVLSDGRLVVFDPGNSRVQVYGPDGAPEAEWTVLQDGMFGPPRLWRDTLDDVYVPYYERIGKAFPFTSKPGLIRISPDGATRDTTMLPETGFKLVTVRVEQDEDNGRQVSIARYSVPYTPSESWAFEPAGYLVHAISSHYRIDLLRTKAPVLRIERAWRPVPVSEKERAARRASIERLARRMVPGWSWPGPAVPDHKPPFTEIHVGRHGRIWVVVSMPSREQADPDFDPKDPTSQRTIWTQPVAFDVFEPDGTYLGRVRAPSDLLPWLSPVFDGNHVWAVTRDSLGVERVVRYRVAADTTGANAS